MAIDRILQKRKAQLRLCLSFLQQKTDKTSINFRELYKKSDTLLDNLTKQ